MITTIDCIRFLLKQGLAFHGHDESKDSSNRGNFLELLRFLTDHNEDINVVTFDNAPGNLQMTSNEIKKEIVSCVAIETTNIIINEMGDVLFSLLINESHDISVKEQMVVVLRYVDKNGYVVERFIGIEHITSTTSISLKEALDRLFSKHGLSMSRLRGQGYDGASNMQAKRRVILQEKHAQAIIKALDDGELSSGRDMQLQELSNCFNETNTELLLCVACLCPNDSFAAFDKQKLLRLTEFYPNDFFPVDLVALETQLDVYIMDVSFDNNFSGIKGIGELARKLVETKKDQLYSLVYLLVTLPLILPVATATVERAFSAMNFVKNRLRN
ncbi:zinc finger MYM-type protein 1 [Citrus clementina]|uniref:zinc finger MYM-type protein 1 n=1 Tax=Citrus clementina TaxID=85681 RepID=UPI000CED5FB1|nr:zinc finger MYM-type protein 1 [Citrus x clementina]